VRSEEATDYEPPSNPQVSVGRAVEGLTAF